MSLIQSMTRMPRPYDPDLGAQTVANLPGIEGPLGELLIGVAGSSPYLKGLMEREKNWLAEACEDPAAALDQELTAARNLPPDQLKPGLRQAKRRVALMTALCDLAGAWPLEEVTGRLTDLGGLAADVTIKAEIAALIRRKKMPGLTEADVETAGGLTILAMGKMGAHELNYSSDIDLICLFDDARFDRDDFQEARAGFIRATRNMAAALNDRTADGYVFRTDLRLRPDPAVTPVCVSMEAAERYYESLGRTWERAAYIKARPCAGDLEAGARFIKALRPFIWRRHLDFAAIQDAHDMRLRIRENKGTGGGITVPGHDMKLGRGGIREIEFFTQTRQLIAGGRDPELRLRGTCEGLAALAQKDWIPVDVAEKLSAHYRAHREVEHRIQMVQDAQTHKVPNSEDGLARVACLMGLSVEEMQSQIHARLEEVHELTEGFFAPDGPSAPATPEAVELDETIMARWVSYPALRSERGAQIFERLRPELLARLAQAEKPDEALVALDGFLAGLPAGVQLFSLFEANPQLIDLLIDIVGTSPALAQYLARNASVFDAVIGGDFFADWPGYDSLLNDLQTRLVGESDYETRLDSTRGWVREWQFRIGVHLLRGLVSAQDAGHHYADLANAVLVALWPVVVAQFSEKHGPPPGRGAALLGMGSLGAARLNARSDLDVIAIYDPGDAEMSEGRKPLAIRPYYARLTQAMITAMTAPMSQGRLYEVDMRLRPSGSQGPVATSWLSFQDYQRGEAWLWEHLALTRARAVTGEETLAQDLEGLRQEIIGAKRDRAEVLQNVQEMRERLQAAKTAAGVWDTKTGPGRLMDIELLAEAGALLSASSERSISAGLKGAVAIGWLSDADRLHLQTAYDLYWAVLIAAKLLSSKVVQTDQIRQGGAAFLCRTTGFDTLEALIAKLEQTYAQTAEMIDRLVKGG